VCIALCTIVAHNIAQNRPDSFLPYPPDNHHCSFELQLYHKHTTLEYRILGCFGTWKIFCAEIRKFFTGVRMRKAIHVCCFKNGRNRFEISGRKAALPWWQKKQNTFWHSGAELIGRFRPFFLCECAPCPLANILNFIQICSVFGEVITEKPVHEALK